MSFSPSTQRKENQRPVIFSLNLVQSARGIFEQESRVRAQTDAWLMIHKSSQIRTNSKSSKRCGSYESDLERAAISYSRTHQARPSIPCERRQREIPRLRSG